jgi:hypothetical protein
LIQAQIPAKGFGGDLLAGALIIPGQTLAEPQRVAADRMTTDIVEVMKGFEDFVMFGLAVEVSAQGPQGVLEFGGGRQLLLARGKTRCGSFGPPQRIMDFRNNAEDENSQAR